MSEIDELKARIAQLEALLQAQLPKNPDPDLLSRAEAAAFLGLTPFTLDAYRKPGHQQGRSLAFVKAPNGRISYRREALEAFKAARVK